MPTSYITPAVVNEYTAKELDTRWLLTALGSLFGEEPALEKWVEDLIAREITTLDSFSRGGFSTCALIPVEYDRLVRKWLLRGVYMGTKRVNGDLDKSLKLGDLSQGEPKAKKLLEGGYNEIAEVEPTDFDDPLAEKA